MRFRCFLVFLACAVRAWGEDVTIEYYDVQGQSLGELRAEMLSRLPKNDGR